MKNRRFRQIRWGALALLVGGVWGFCYCPGAGEWYARHCYPSISYGLSRLASVVPFSLEEVLVIGGGAAALVAMMAARSQGVRWRKLAAVVLESVLWLYVWFYWAWGMNYFRAGLLERVGVEHAVYDETRFRAFLADYTSRLNAAYLPEQPLDLPVLQELLQTAFGQVEAVYGLCRPYPFQHPKRSCCNALYSGVGVLGYMGPFFAESHVNHDLLVRQYPFTYAHELSHLLGVSSEAEANYWAYRICISSTDAYVRFCGYYGLLGYVLTNAQGALPQEDFVAWWQTVRPEVRRAYREHRLYWRQKYSPLLGHVQDKLYTLYLKGNKISSGQKNYAQVIDLLLSLSAL